MSTTTKDGNEITTRQSKYACVAECTCGMRRVSADKRRARALIADWVVGHNNWHDQFSRFKLAAQQ
jgi:hypothetical protein